MLQRLSSTDTRCESNSRIKFARANLMLQWTPAVDTRCEGSVTSTRARDKKIPTIVGILPTRHAHARGGQVESLAGEKIQSA